MIENKFVAHIKKGSDGSFEEPHLLEQHLKKTGELAGIFAREFSNEDWGILVGELHDIGKYHPDWQKYIKNQMGFLYDGTQYNNILMRPNHSSAGAHYLLELFRCSIFAKAIAYIIAGHHSGLPDWNPQLQQRLYDYNGNIKDVEIKIIKELTGAKQFLDRDIPKSVPAIVNNDFVDWEQFHLWIRMLFSCLVDADFLDTENYMDKKERGKYLSISELKNIFDKYMSSMKPDTNINKMRNNILKQCREKAKLNPGFFSLTVPTGGGKTLSSMAFALEHAIKHNKKRVIMAIPYTSIIEQTAEIYKSVFGKDQVVEHHSNLDPEKEEYKNRIACENWDAPIIVTTNVQLFESLFGYRTSTCRKIHNIVNSIIILDEAQMIPFGYLKPILSVLKGLVKYFGVTVVFMSATQPALKGRIGTEPNVTDGIENLKEIIDDPDKLSKDFKRVNFIIPNDYDIGLSWDEIANKIMQYDQVLCIVNTRSDCREIHKRMPQGTIHLSGYMCGEERSKVISEIKEKLKKNEPISVISTQIVEAGVDIDFPVVYRAITGLDSIVQAAGRCNRENKIKEGGKVYIFIPQRLSPTGFLRKCEDAGKAILRKRSYKEFTPSMLKEYFQYLYSNINSFDSAGFYDNLVKDATNFEFQFKTFAERFNIIDDKKQISIIVKYNNSPKFINELKFAGASKDLLRKLQRYIVNVPIYIFEKLRKVNFIENINGYWVQSDDNLYKPGIGLLVDDDDLINGSFVI